MSMTSQDLMYIVSNHLFSAGSQRWHFSSHSFKSTTHPSCCTNGFAIGSMPSIGHTKTTDVPRHTTSPNCLVSSVSLYESSGSASETN